MEPFAVLVRPRKERIAQRIILIQIPYVSRRLMKVEMIMLELKTPSKMNEILLNRFLPEVLRMMISMDAGKFKN